MKLLSTISNILFLILKRKTWNSFMTSCNVTAEVQQEVLFTILKKNSTSSFGREFNFNSIKTIKEFQSQVPLSTYEDYAESLHKIMYGKKDILCSESVIYFALSSGSSAASKYIPYTQSLKEEFNKAIDPWIYDLLRHFKKLKFGTQFWIITPTTLPETCPESKIPIGFEDDLNYFGKIGRYLLRSVMCLPAQLSKIRDHSNYFHLLSYCLLRDRHLRLISVWNPGLLILILDYIKQNYTDLCRDIFNGTIILPNVSIQSDVQIAIEISLKMKRRGKHLRKLQIFSSEKVMLIWPKLQLISCWADAWASTYIKQLKASLPGIQIQGKGIMATEGAVSIPIEELPFPALSIQSHFFEFRGVKDGKIYLAHELSAGENYELIVTTSGGFYRYQMNDIVKVNAFYKQAPLFEFIGKSDLVSDICGEKLHEAFIFEVIKEISNKFFNKETRIFLAPGRQGNVFYYALYVQETHPIDISTPDKIIDELDLALMENFHYKHCRKMNQLERPKLKLLKVRNESDYQSIRQCNALISTHKFNTLEKSLLNPEDYEGIIYS